MRERVLVTGANRGIGRAIVDELGARDYEVVATARALRSLDDLPCDLRLELDVTDPDSVTRAVSDAGRVDVLINNAGVGVGGPTEAVPIDDAMRQFDTNFFGAARLIRAVLPAMRSRRAGTIVNISSLSARVPWPFGGYYAASKAALETLSEALDMEVAPLGIRVLLIEPGIVETDFGGGFRVHTGDPDDYGPRSDAWGRQFERPHIGSDVVATALADALQTPDGALRVAVGEDALELLNLRSRLGETEFATRFRHLHGLEGQ